MKRLWITVLTILAIAIFVTSCGSGKHNGENNNTVTMTHLWRIKAFTIRSIILNLKTKIKKNPQGFFFMLLTVCTKRLHR